MLQVGDGDRGVPPLRAAFRGGRGLVKVPPVGAQHAKFTKR